VLFSSVVAAKGFARIRRTAFFGSIFLLIAASFLWAKDPVKSLAPHYREWLTKDVAYIISNQEKTAFLELPNDDTRDQFIERFWEVRNPTPGSPDNSYKIEHYRRIEYANQYFGHVSHTPGWRTDMGRVYITLGEPQQRQKLLGLQKITPMEIWFYSNANRALPPFFYVIFFQQDPSDEFKLYSPYSDGPEKLITAVAGPSRQEALQTIAQDAGKDVARETLSLMTDEPVDFSGGTVSLQSDVMLATIRNLANNPISQQDLANRRHILEDVSHRIVLGNEYLDVVTVPLRNVEGNTNLHYVLRLKKPEDFSVAQSPGGKGYYYAVLMSVKVSLPDGKLIWSEDRKVSNNLTNVELEDVKSKLFGYEGWLPLPPNKYKLDFQLTNLVSNTAYRSQVEVSIPEADAHALQVSNLVAFSDARMLSPEALSALPFSGAGVKFTPMAGQELQVVAGGHLNFFYQVWDPSALAADRTGKKLEVQYDYGRMGARDTQTIHDEIPLEQLDKGGSVLNGKRIVTGDLQPGNYRLVMTVHDPSNPNQNKVYGVLSFTVLTTGSQSPAWDVYDSKLTEALRNGAIEFQRARCYESMGDTVHALEWFQLAYSKNASNELYRDKLVELYFGHQNYSKVAELFSKSSIDSSTSEQAILRLAASLEKTGDVKRALAVMESGTELHPSSGPLLLGLAEYYRKVGDSQKAAAAEQKGKRLLSPQPVS
jgi:GWxTD domain-containing protein